LKHAPRKYATNKPYNKWLQYYFGLGRSGLTPHHSYPRNASFKGMYSNLKLDGLISACLKKINSRLLSTLEMYMHPPSTL